MSTEIELNYVKCGNKLCFAHIGVLPSHDKQVYCCEHCRIQSKDKSERYGITIGRGRGVQSTGRKSTKKFKANSSYVTRNMKLIEELNELQREVIRLASVGGIDSFKQKVSLLEEVADVFIMLNQFVYDYGLTDQLNICIQDKLIKAKKKLGVRVGEEEFTQ